MVLTSFSDPSHVEKIFSGEKAQTTRLRRKIPFKVGDRLDIFYKSRMVKGTCKNCINMSCDHSAYTNIKQGDDYNGENCNIWYNKFGSATVTKVSDLDIYVMSPQALEAWAIADGFESFNAADEWFTRVHKPTWINMDFVVIQFEGDWVYPKWSCEEFDNCLGVCGHHDACSMACRKSICPKLKEIDKW